MSTKTNHSAVLREGLAATSTRRVIDVAAWIGAYPFRGIPSSSPVDLLRSMERLGIERTIVSSFESIFWENTVDAYFQSLLDYSGPKAVEIWPVVRPGATFGLEKLLDQFKPRGLRLLPNYHSYRLSDACVEPIMKLARERKMIVQVFARIADERWHHMLKVPGVDQMDLDYLTSVYTDQPILISGAASIGPLASRLREQPFVYADISRVRGPQFAIEKLLTELPADKLVFGSLWPIQIIESTLWQVTTANIPAKVQAKLLYDNAQKLLANACELVQLARMAQGALADRVIVINGGTSGLGLSAAHACIAAGAKVVAVGRDDEAIAHAQQTLGSNACVFPAEATNPSTAETAIRRAIDQFGGFHALYHVAGGSGRRFGDGPLHEITDDGWRSTFDLNLTSLFLSNRAAVRQFMTQQTGGVVLNMSSVLAFAPSPAHFATHAYAAAKSAVIGFTKSCAAYYADQSIRFNVLAPGLIETPMSKRAATDETIMQFIATKQPLDGGRIGRPEDLDAAVVYLLSDQSQFVTGQVLAIDGGWSVSEGQSIA